MTYVKAVKFRNAIVRNQLRDGRVPLGEPSKELGNTMERLAWVPPRAVLLNAHPMIDVVLWAGSQFEIDGPRNGLTTNESGDVIGGTGLLPVYMRAKGTTDSMMGNA